MTITKVPFHQAYSLVNPRAQFSSGLMAFSSGVWSDIPGHGHGYSRDCLSESSLVAALAGCLSLIQNVENHLREVSRGKAKGGEGAIEPKMYAYWDALRSANDTVLACECPIPGRGNASEREEVETTNFFLGVGVERICAVLKRTVESEERFKQLAGGGRVRRVFHRGSWITEEYWQTLADDLTEVTRELGAKQVKGTRIM